MSTIPTATVTGIIRDLLREAYEGPAPNWAWFVNAEPDTGVLGSIADLSADKASATATENGRSIAAHVEHLRWSLATVNATFRGEHWQPDWSASWTVQTVDETQWRKLQADLKQELKTVLKAIEQHDDWSDRMMLTGVMAMAPHAAHHLGTIRQMARLIGR